MVYILIKCQICYTIQAIIIYIQLETIPYVFFMYQSQDYKYIDEAFQYTGPNFCNDIPNEIKNSQTLMFQK